MHGIQTKDSLRSFAVKNANTPIPFLLHPLWAVGYGGIGRYCNSVLFGIGRGKVYLTEFEIVRPQGFWYILFDPKCLRYTLFKPFFNAFR